VTSSAAVEWVGAPRRTSEDPDAELLARWRAGDSGAFEDLVRRHEGRVYRFLLRMLGDSAEAEDVAQETFLSLHRNGRRFRGESLFSTFVYRVAANGALNRKRGLGRRGAWYRRFAENQAIGQNLPAAPPNPEIAASDAQLHTLVQRELLRVPDALRAPLVLYDVEGLSYAEIARALGVPEGTVKSRIHRARRLLRERLRPLLDERDGDAE
jgi:RNA polymerase sigma-70 factor (ECF subfamily)